MSTCKRITTTNKNDSKLFNTLYYISENNESLAEQYYSYFKSQEFKEDFGDFEKDYEEIVSLRSINQSNIDDNGEPKLFLDKDKNKYFYKNKENKKVYFPKKENKLKSIFSNKDIKSVSNALAFHYIKHNTSFVNNFDNFEETNETKESLKTSIINKLNGKIIEFESSGDFHKQTLAEYLKESLNYVDEWVNEVSFKFRNLKLVYDEKFEEDVLAEEETSERGQVFDRASFETSYKNGINSAVKLTLSFLQDPEKLDDILNEPIFLNFDEVYGSLLNILNTVSVNENENIFEKYLDIIQKYSVYKPYLKNLYKKLSTEKDEHFINKFSQAFRLNKINFLSTTISKSKKENGDTLFTHTVQNMSSVGSKSKMILGEWSSGYRKLFLNKEGLFDDNSRKKVNLINKELNDFSIDYDTSKVEDLYKNVNKFLNILKDLGIETTENGINFYLNSNSENELSEQDKYNNLRKLISSTKYLIDRVLQNKINYNKSNIFNDQFEIDKLSKSESFFMSEGSDASIFSAGKSKWIFSKPSYLSTKINLWKSNPDILLQHYLSTPNTSNSYYMEHLLAFDVDEDNRAVVSRERLDKFNIGVFNSLQEEGDATNAVDNKELSENDQYADFVNKMLSFIKGAETWVATPTPADKSNQYEINYGDVFINSKVQFEFANKRFNITSLGTKVEDIFFEYFKGEYERMKNVSSEILAAKENGDDSNLRVHYHLGNKNGLKSQIFPSLSPKFNKNGSVVLPELNGLHLFDNNGHPLVLDGNYVNLDLFKDQIVKLILPLANDSIIKSYNKLKSINLFDIDDKGNTVNNAIDNQIFDHYYNENPKTAGFKIAVDSFVNGFISQVEYGKMFSGDPSYYKNMIDYKKRIPATYTDGLQLRLNEKEQIFNVAVIDGVEIPTESLENLKKYLPEEIWNYYSNINSTNAQAWITPERWKFLIDRLGKGSTKVDTVYKKMIGKNNKPFTKNELKLVAQPLKGVYFEINSNVPVFLKYSQAVLLPKLIKNSQLEKIYNKMVFDENGKRKPYQDQIHEVITIDGVKVGANKPTRTHDEKGNVISEKHPYIDKDGNKFTDFNFTPLQLKNSGWKLQQDLPVKGMHDTMIGSQIQKNIFQGLAFNLEEDFYIGSEKISGKDLIDHINDIIGDLSNLGKEDLKELLDIDEDGKINNLESFYSMLSEELKERDGSRNLLEALEAELSPYAIPQAQSKLINVFSSIVNKRLIKIKTNGGSYIQMSNYGINFNEAKDNGVILLTNSLRTYEPKYYKDTNGVEKIKPAGVFISGSFIAEHIPDYREFIDKYGIDEFKKSIDPRILKNIIGYRIPNQGLASNDALEIIGILPEESGDTIVAYTGITTKTGSDFDIDKMYLMIPSFKYEDGKLNYIEYNKNSSISLKDGKLKVGYEKGALQNRLIETYKAVLTNKNVIKDVMTPIDFAYVKDMILKMYPEKESEDMSDFNSFDDIALKYDFKAGKAGVGQEANALVDHVRGMMAELSLNGFYLGVGNKNNLNETLFDSQYSESLSDKDMSENNIDKSLKKIKIANTLSAILNAFVDIAKDPYITRGNWNTLTTNTGNMLLRAGVHPAYVTSFLGQPIIKEYVKFSNNRESKIVSDTGKIKDKFQLNLVAENLDLGGNNYIDIDGKVKTFSAIYKALVKKAPKSRYVDEVEGTLSNLTNTRIADFIGVELTNENAYRFDAIVNKISNEHKNIFYTKTIPFNEISLKDFNNEILNRKTNKIQLSALNAFFEFQEKSKEIRNNVMASKQDVNGFGKNYTSLLSTYNQISQLLINEENEVIGSLKGFDTKLEKEGKKTILGHYTENSIYWVKELMEKNPKLFFTSHQGIVNTFNEIAKDVQSGLLTDTKLGDVLEQEYYSYLLSGFGPFKMSNDEKDDLINNFPKEFKNFKDSNKQDYIILEELSVMTGEKGKLFVGLSNAKKSTEYEANITDSWNDLLNDHKEEALKLIKYSYLTSGFKMNKSQFYSLIPYQFFVENKIDEYLTEQSKNVKDFDISFLKQLYRNNYNNNRLVPNYFSSDVLTNRQDYPTVKNFDQFGLRSAFKLNTTDKARFYVKSSIGIIDENGNLNTEPLLYELKGYDSEFRPIYVRVNVLGYSDKKGNKAVEYGFNESVKSFINPNIKVVVDHYNEIQDEVVYPFDYFNQYINVQQANSLKNKANKTISIELSESETPRFTIKRGKTEVGFIDYSDESGELSVDNIVVYDKYRGNSYGKESLSLLEEATGMKIKRNNQESELGKKMFNKFENEKFFNENKESILNKYPDITLSDINQMNEEELNNLKECL